MTTKKIQLRLQCNQLRQPDSTKKHCREFLSRQVPRPNGPLGHATTRRRGQVSEIRRRCARYRRPSVCRTNAPYRTTFRAGRAPPAGSRDRRETRRHRRLGARQQHRRLGPRVPRCLIGRLPAPCHAGAGYKSRPGTGAQCSPALARQTTGNRSLSSRSPTLRPGSRSGRVMPLRSA